jgi:ABC-type transporter Mla maintaining outer membrane lipid asymmetry permease subunit MlaE
MTWKKKLLDAAEVVDAWRIMPRILVISFMLFTIVTIADLLEWYKALPATERQLEASGFAFGVITALSGLLTAVIKIYQSTGRKWGTGSNKENSE